MRGGSFARALPGGSPTGAATAAHGTPGDRPPAVLAMSRCRARQHHGQAVSLAPDVPGAVNMSHAVLTAAMSHLRPAKCLV